LAPSETTRRNGARVRIARRQRHATAVRRERTRIPRGSIVLLG